MSETKGWELIHDRGKTAWAYDGIRFGMTELKDARVEYDPECIAKLLEEAKVEGFDKAKNPNSGDKLYRLLKVKEFQNSNKDGAKKRSKKAKVQKKSSGLADSAEESARKGIEYYQQLQIEDDGFWPGDYGGPLFLMPGLVIACYVTKVVIPTPHRFEMVRYLFNHQNADGGWGLHIEKLNSTIFGTALNYVALRLLQVPAEDARMQKCRDFLHAHGGAGGIPSWGKFWLAVCGVYEWEGVSSIFPELWILPQSLPIHPWRWWCHCRMVYLPMTYIYGHRVTCDITDLIKEIRTEIYPDPYESIDWKSYRTKVAKIDEYRGHSSVLEFAFAVANFYEDKVRIPFLRKKSLDFLIDYVRAEDDQTLFVDIGPVNKVINMLCRWHADGPDSDGFKKHVARLEDYLWLAEDGLKMQGYNGSQLWDTSFAVMAINETGLESEFRDCLLKAYHYMDITQVEEDVPNREKYFRHISKGGWPFSTKDHGWPIADCTAHGLEAVLQLHEKVDSTGAPLVPKNLRISDERIFDAVNVLISFENEGGWATYENTRGSAKLEWLNPSEVFGDIMIDYSYTELTSSVVQALCTFREQYPDHRSSEVNGCIERGCQYITTRQRDHGGWYGSWAVCFTYGTWFAIEALVKSGMPKDSPAIMRGCQFLVERQMEDGGWGESYLSSVTHEWHSHEKSQVVNTAWALIALMLADFDGFHRPAIDKGIKLLLSRQDKDGDWEQEAISGVFNGNCMITYTAYRNVFPIRALGMYTRKYGNPANLH